MFKKLRQIKEVYVDGESDPDAVGSLEEAPLDTPPDGMSWEELEGDNSQLADSHPSVEEPKE